MDGKRRSDMLFNVLMIVIGLVPIGFVSFELLTGASVPTPVEGIWILEVLWRVVGSVCGLVLAAVGAIDIKRGSEPTERSDDTRLL